MNWKAFLKAVLVNATYAKDLIAVLPFLPGKARAALVVVCDHASKHSDCIVELADKLSQALLFGQESSESYGASIQPVAEEVNTIRTTLTELGLYTMDEESGEYGHDCPEDEDCCEDEKEEVVDETDTPEN